MLTRLREYIVTLKDAADLEFFYQEMETLGGKDGIPRRAVECRHRRAISRSTHYMLYESEARNLKNDPRVLSIELSFEEANVRVKPVWTETSSFWNKSFSLSSSHRNFALLRCIEGENRVGWGTDLTTNVSGTAATTSNGKNVDVVIVDGHIDPNHPEFAKNSDGTGGSRVIQYNWFQHNPQVTGGAAGTYVYTPYVDPSYADDNGDGISDRTADNDHGAEVASVSCGNRQGWAREANIYNISPYGTSPSYSGYWIDYIREFHKNKPVNPVTGVKNPTITNHSYGFGTTAPVSSITQVKYRGVEYEGPFTESDLINFGIYVSGGEATIVVNYGFFDQDCLDAMKEGIIFVSAAGNESTPLAAYSTNLSSDYYNYLNVDNYYTYAYMRGSIAAQGAIVVGAVGANSAETVASYSNTGPRVDVYAPGSLVMVGKNSNTGTTVGDPRNTTYRYTKVFGTSFSSPQVAGAVACLAEQWPTMTSAAVREYIIQKSTTNQMNVTQGGRGDYTDIQGGNNRYLKYFKDRPENGMVGPKVNQGARATSGQVWPRTKIFRYGR